MDAKRVIFWFRRDLRWKDNHGLFRALSSGHPVIPIFIFDSEILSSLPEKDARVEFIHQQIQEIHAAFAESGSGVWVFHGKPLEVFKEVVAKFHPSEVFANEDYEPYAIQRDQKVAKYLKSKGVGFQTFKDQVIFAKDEVTKDDGLPYTVFTPYSRKWLKTLSEIPTYQSQNLMKNLELSQGLKPPSLKSLGFLPSNIEFPPKSISKSILRNYKKLRDLPAAQGTSRLGLHLRFGTLSIRKAFEIARQYSPTWTNELIWREFFMMILYHFPQTVDQPFRPQYKKIEWRNNRRDFQRWCQGTTGYPLVDAGMRELNATGFMHNRVRMVVASFLTKHLLIEWQWGERYFAEKLLDFELSSNVGNWQWAAGCGCDAAPYFRVFNPALQQKKFDPNKEYIRKWIPELETAKYPKPIVEHELARRRVLTAYHAALKGDSL